MHSSGDSATLDMTAVKDKCDLFLNNDGNDMVAFKEQIVAALSI
jgi:hypothetical protein